MLVCAGIVAEFLAMFWSHWWFLTRMPEVLEYLPGNADYKSYQKAGLLFLNDLLGEWQYVFLAGALAIQASLGLMLVRFRRTEK